MCDGPARAQTSRRLLTGILVVFLLIGGCSPASDSPASATSSDGAPKPSLKERRTKRLQELQKKSTSD